MVDQSVIPVTFTSSGSKFKSVSYSQTASSLIFSVQKTVISLGDIDITYGAREYITETLDQVLVNFGICGRNDNIIQATGSNNKQYSWEGTLWYESSSKFTIFELKDNLEKLIRSNNPVPYKVFYFKDAIQVYVNNVSFNIKNECYIEYSIACTEYSPPTIVSLDVQTWMSINGDFTSIVDTPVDNEDSDPCSNFSIIPFTQDEIDDDSVDKGKGYLNTSLDALTNWLNDGENRDVYESSQVRESLFGEYTDRSEVWQDIEEKCKSCINTDTEKGKLKAFFNAAVAALLQRIMELYSTSFIGCLTLNDLQREDQYKIHMAMLDKLFRGGMIGIVVQGINFVFYDSDGNINCMAVCAITRTFLGIGNQFNITFNVKDVIFNDECCDASTAKKTSTKSAYNNDEEDDLGEGNKDSTEKQSVLCPQSPSKIASCSSEDFLYEYSCWKKDGGTYSGSPTYKEITCPEDVLSSQEDYPDIFISYDNSFPRMDEVTRTIDASSLIYENNPSVQDRKVYAGADGTITSVQTTDGISTVFLKMTSTKYDFVSEQYNEFSLIYSNLSLVYVDDNQSVKSGDLIGLADGGNVKIIYTINGKQYPFTLCFGC